MKRYILLAICPLLCGCGAEDLQRDLFLAWLGQNQDLVGPQGEPGNDGQDGASGNDGISGQDGLEGLPGEQGQPGPPGPEGPEGMVGPEGPLGEESENTGDMITICHNGQTITIDENAVDAHLVNHDDYLGECLD